MCECCGWNANDTRASDLKQQPAEFRRELEQRREEIDRQLEELEELEPAKA